ncbi:MAG: hypothetical protein K8F91_09310, partial [Candidatus Obscuribacterales bacterium]|nr:hypothetical protein [Candidatus Obscuribacterales bacterium]
VNFGFLSRLSKLSGATASFVTPGDALEDALRQIARDIGTPILTDLAICGLDCTIVGNALTPKRVLDLFSGRTSDVFFTYRPGDKVEPRLLIEGKYQDGSRFSQEVLIHKAQIAGVARFWAKEMIGELEDEFRVCRGDTASLQAKIVGISKTFSVLSRFTAFTCVDNEEKTNDTGVVREIVQPVHNPSGWSIVSPVSQSSSIGSVNQGGLYGCAPGTAGGAWGVSSFGPSQDQDQGQSQNQNEGWGEPPMGGAWDACDSGSISGFAGGWGFAPPPARKSVSAGSNWAVPHQARNQSRLRRLGKQESKSEITGPLNRVSTAIEAYRDVWSKAWQQIENGLLPDPQTIEDAVKELLDALDDHPAGFQMSPLIRHLNSNSKSFVSALRAPNLTLPAIKAMRVQLHVGYEQAMVEALGVIEKALRKGSAFWESTV